MAGDGKLTGTVKIAEGLTSSSSTTGDIKFSTATSGTKKDGQGYYGIIPSGEVKTGPIMTSENIGETRQADGDGTVTVDVAVNQDGPGEVTGMYNSTDNPMVVDLQGKKLSMLAHGADSRYLEALYVQEGKNIKVTDSAGNGKLSISTGIDSSGAEDTTSRARTVNGIGVDSNGTFESEGDVEITAVRSKGTKDTNGVSLSGSSGTSTAILTSH